jgi:hypothetical protein
LGVIKWKMDPGTDRAWSGDVACRGVNNRGARVTEGRLLPALYAEREHGCANDDSRQPAGQQFGLPHAATGCVCTETTIAVPVPSASASKARIKVVTFMILSPQSG